MNEYADCEFVVENETNDREYPIPQLTGWETVVFRLQEEPEIDPAT